MKNIIKITLVFVFLLLVGGLATKVSANTYDVNDDINLGKYNIYCRQGTSYIRYKGVGQLNYMYYYKDYNNVEHKAFCLNLGLKGAEAGDYTVDVNDIIKDPKVSSILISGSPYKTLEELGLNNEDEASFATQSAVWVYLNNLDINQITPYASGNENVVNAIKNIYTNGMNMDYNSKALLDISKNGKSGIDNLDRQYYSQAYKLDYNSNVKNISISISGINDAIISDMSNNSLSSMNNIKEFKILIPRNNISEDKELTLNLKAEAKQTSVMFGATNIEDRQNMALLLNPVSYKNIQDNINIEYESAKINIKKVDKDTGIGIEGVTFRFETLTGENLGTYTTGKDGIIELDAEKDLKIFKEEQIKVTEIAVPDIYYIDKDNCTQVLNLKYGETAVAIFKNEKIRGKIKIIKLSEDDNKYTSLLAHSPIENVVFEITDSNNNVVDTITTNEQGIAVTKDLLKGTYKIKEIKQGKYYLLNYKMYEVEISNQGEEIEQIIYNKSVDIDIEIEKYGFIETQNKDNIFYNFKNIHNKSNVQLDDFTWQDTLPNEVRLDKIITGTWNEKLNYSVWYKTNLNDYKLFKDNLDSENIYELDFNNIELKENEYITEFEFRFGTVKPDFHEIEPPIVYVNVLDGLKNGYTFTNNTKVFGNYLEEYVEDYDKWTTIIYNREVKLNKELPKTGC